MEEGFRGRGRGGGSNNIMSTAANSGGGAAGGGWPLGLQPLHVMSRLAAAANSRELQLFNLLHYSRRSTRIIHGGGGASPFFLSTPSISSLSSSDLDTESTGSFFPETGSTTLGSLIGIHHPRQTAGRLLAHRLQEQQRGAADDGSQLALHNDPKHHLKATQRLQACWCAAFTLLLRCASSHCRAHVPSHDSLAHLLELERRAAAHTQERYPAALQCESFNDNDITFEDGDCSHHHSSLNTLFSDDSILPPHAAGAPSKVALHKFTATSPTNSAYPSTDWNGSVPIPRGTKHYHLANNPSNNFLCPRFWKVG